MKAPRPVLAAALVLAAAAPRRRRAAAAGAARRAARTPASGRGRSTSSAPTCGSATPSEMYVSSYDGQDAPARDLRRARAAAAGRWRCTAQRDGPKKMRVTQRIYKVGGGHITVRTDASLHFTDVGEYFGGSYWKVHQLARFELRKVLPDGGLGPVAADEPEAELLPARPRPHPARAGAPPLSAHYPGCNQDPTSAATSSAPRSAGRTSTPPTTTSSTSTSAACAAASSSR